MMECITVMQVRTKQERFQKRINVRKKNVRKTNKNKKIITTGNKKKKGGLRITVKLSQHATFVAAEIRDFLAARARRRSAPQRVSICTFVPVKQVN